MVDLHAPARTIAIIGSFKQHYGAVLEAHQICTDRGLAISTPVGSAILEEGIAFVRFETDHGGLTDAAVQQRALDLILAAAAVYVVAPDGYVGRTTCYEIGRILERRVPLYFSDLPLDLPIDVDAAHILDATAFASLVLRGRVTPLGEPHEREPISTEG